MWSQVIIKFWLLSGGLLFSRSVMSDSLQPHGLQHTRLPCPSFTISQGLLKLISIESVMPSNHLVLCHLLLLLPPIFPHIWVFSSESLLHIRWPKYWSFSFRFSPSNEFSGLISFRIDFLQSMGLLRVFSNTTVWKHQFFNSQLLYGPTLTSIHDYLKSIALTIGNDNY